MERLIAAGGITKMPDYNCSSRSLNEWATEGQKRPLLGTAFIIFGIFCQVWCYENATFQLLYLPCLVVIFRPGQFCRSGYKVMAYMGVLDIASSIINVQAGTRIDPLVSDF